MVPVTICITIFRSEQINPTLSVMELMRVVNDAILDTMKFLAYSPAKEYLFELSWENYAYLKTTRAMHWSYVTSLLEFIQVNNLATQQSSEVRFVCDLEARR